MKALYRKILCILLCVFLMPCALAEEWTVGDKGDGVKAMQEALIEVGFLSGAADGHFGEMTKEAVLDLEEYLQEVGCDVIPDGIWTDDLYGYLADEDIMRPWYCLSMGDTGDAVYALQARLYELGFLTQSRADFTFGELTYDAVLRFQQALIDQGAEDVVADGIAGEVTLRYLHEEDLSRFHFVTPVFYDESAPLSLRADHLYATSAILIDADTGSVLFTKDPTRPLYPASTTKIMTLLLALEQADLDETITIPACAMDIPNDSSKVPVRTGEVMTWRDLLHGLMIKSGNDAANAAAWLLSGSVESFVEDMNARAASLGLKGTHYVNPHGYHDDDHYTTAMDMAILTRFALQEPAFRDIISCREYQMAATVRREEYNLKNTYEILNPQSEYYYSPALGGKTGYTSAAGRCFVGVAEKDGHTLICCVFDAGCKTEHKFVDAARLFEFGFAALEGK